MELKYTDVTKKVDWDVFEDVHYLDLDQSVSGYIRSFVEDYTYQVIIIDINIVYPVRNFLNDKINI